MGVFIRGRPGGTIQVRSPARLASETSMTDTLRFRCYYCHRIHTVSGDAAGKRGRCVCGKLMLVPSVMADVAASPQSIPLALPPAVSPPEGEVADLELDARPEAQPPASSSPRGQEPATGTRRLEATRVLPKETVWMERAGRPEAARKGGNPVLGSMYIILSLVALAAWVLHQFFSGSSPAMGRLLWAADPNFAGLPAAFWSTVFLSLAIALFLEGVHRVRRREA